MTVDTRVCPTAAHGPFHPRLDVCCHPHMWALPMDTPRRTGPATPLWFPGTHGHTRPARHRHTQTHPCPAAGSQILGPDAPPSAATPTRPTGPGAPTATQPRGRHFCTLCSQAHPQCHTHTHTHTHVHIRTWVCSLASLPTAIHDAMDHSVRVWRRLHGRPAPCASAWHC